MSSYLRRSHFYNVVNILDYTGTCREPKYSIEFVSKITSEAPFKLCHRYSKLVCLNCQTPIAPGAWNEQVFHLT